MKHFLFLMLFLVFLGIAYQSNAQTQSSVKAFQSKLASTQKPQIIDVRTPDEYKVGHLKDAKNINLYDAKFKESVAKLDKNKPVFVYCKGGVRSYKANQILIEMGFKEIIDLAGGYDAWKWAGLEVVK